MSFNEETVLKQLTDLLGKEFTIPEFANAHEYDIQKFAEYFFELDKQNKLDFILTSKGAIRLKHVLNQSILLENVEDNKFSFPKDLKLYKLIIFSLGLELNLRIEFDKCMEENHFVEKFKEMNESELLIFLKNRAEFFAVENKKLLHEKEIEKENLSAVQVDNDEILQLTTEEKTKIIEAQAKYQKQNNQKITKTEQDFKVVKEQKLELERKRNYLVTGYHETNQEKYKRLAIAREDTEQLKRDNFKARIEERKKYVENYFVGQVVTGKIVKKIPIGLYVDLGESDGFISVTNLDPLVIRKYSSKFRVGSTLNCEITYIDVSRGNIDIIPTSKKITALKKLNNNKSINKNTDKANPETKKKENEKIKKTLEAIIDSGGKDGLKFFTRLIKKNIKDNPSEWSVSLPKNKKNMVRLNNFGLEGSYINDEGIMIVVTKSQNKKNYELDYLIDKFVPAKNKQGKYAKLPMAIPLFLDFKNLKGKKTVIYSAYVDFFEQAKKTGKNSWKNAHDKGFITELSKALNEELEQPDYI